MVYSLTEREISKYRYQHLSVYFRCYILLDVLIQRTHINQYTVELQWLEHLWDYENMFETGVVRASEC